MKATKILLAVSVACTLATASVLAQGRINFANTSDTPILICNFPGGVTNVLGTGSTANFGIGPASVQVSLMAGLTSSSLSPVLIGSAANQPFVLNTSSGIAAAQGTFAGGIALPLPGFDGSVPVFLRFTAESINGLYRGVSPIIQVTPTLAPAAATPVFSTTSDASHWNGILIVPPEFPEPSALVLVGMSFSLMFLARRRRQSFQSINNLNCHENNQDSPCCIRCLLTRQR